MAERSRFWDGSATGDAVSITDNELMDRFFRALLNGTGNQGVLRGWLNELAVTDGGGLNAAVDTGGAISYGGWFENDAAANVACPNNSTVKVVVRRDWATQTTRLAQVAALVQNAGVTYDVPLAEVTTAGGAITVITDERDFCEFSTAMQTGAVTTDSLQADAVTTNKLANQTRWLTRGPGELRPDATGPATAATLGLSSAYDYQWLPHHPYLSFADAATNSAWCDFRVPADFVAGGNLSVYFWTERASTADATATQIRWGFTAWVAAASAVLASTNAEATVAYPARIETISASSGGGTGGIYEVITRWPQNWRYAERDLIGTVAVAAGDIVHLEVYRNGGHGDDSYTGAGALFMVEIAYTADS